MIKTYSLFKHYNGACLLDSINLAVKSGEIFCLLRTNGAGKSITINLFVNFITPTSELAKIGSFDVNRDFGTLRFANAYLSEMVMLYPIFTCVDRVDYKNCMAGYHYYTEQIHEFLQRTGLPRKAVNRCVNIYSKGILQKVGLANPLGVDLITAELLGLTYTLIWTFSCFCGHLSQHVSVWTRFALTVLLVFCVVIVFALPHDLLDLLAQFHSSPSSAFEKEFAFDLAKETEAHVDKDYKEIHEQYNVSNELDLPFGFIGLFMKAYDESSWPTIDSYFNKRFVIYQTQNQLLDWGSSLSLAVRFTFLSMILTGNDRTVP